MESLKQDLASKFFEDIEQIKKEVSYIKDVAKSMQLLMSKILIEMKEKDIDKWQVK